MRDDDFLITMGKLVLVTVLGVIMGLLTGLFLRPR